ncbi:MAG: type VI secretion system tip protein TssI/VgrG [Polyangiales bacterium]
MSTGSDRPDVTNPPPVDAATFGSTTEFIVSRPTREPAPEATFAFEAAALGGAGVRIVEATVREAIGELYEAVVDLCTADVAADFAALLGAPAAIEIGRGPRTRRVCGVVRRVTRLDSWGGFRRARVVMAPAMWALSQRVDSRIYQQLDTIEIVKAVFEEARLGAPVVEVRRDYPQREYCVQYRETDLAFVLRLLEEEGIVLYFRHDGDAEVAVLTDGGTYVLCPTIDRRAVPFSPPQSERAPVEVVQRLEFASELRSTGFTGRDYDFTHPLAELDMTRGHPRGDHGPRPRYEYPARFTRGPYEDDSLTYGPHDGARRAEVRHGEEHSAEGVGAGMSNVTGFMPGRAFELVGHEHGDLDQRYLITHVEHVLRAPEELLTSTDAQSRAHGDARYRNAFYCVTTSAPYVPPRKTPRPMILATQTAVVTGAEGEEIDVDAHGRIKVQFHWDRKGRRDARSSCRIRVSQSWAGGGWGFQFIPRVGMEVVVTFLEGDPDHPLVTGCVYNGVNRPPYELPSERTRSTIKSNSSLGGDGYNELRFEDLKGHEQVFVHAQRDLDEVVRRRHTIKTGEDEHINIGQNQIANIACVQRVNVGRDRFTTVEQSDHESVLADQESVVEGSRTRTVVRDETVTIHGHRTLTVQRGETRIITGGLSTVVQPKPPPPAGHEPPDDDDGRFTNSSEVHGNQLTQVHGREHVEIKDRTTYVERHDELKVEGEYVVNVGESANLLVGDISKPGNLNTGYFITADAMRLGGSRDTLKELTLMRDEDSLSFTPEAITLESGGRDIVVQIAGTGTRIRISGDGDEVEICAKKKITLRAGHIALESGGGT